MSDVEQHDGLSVAEEIAQFDAAVREAETVRHGVMPVDRRILLVVLDALVACKEAAPDPVRTTALQAVVHQCIDDVAFEEAIKQRDQWHEEAFARGREIETLESQVSDRDVLLERAATRATALRAEIRTAQELVARIVVLNALSRTRRREALRALERALALVDGEDQ